MAYYVEAAGSDVFAGTDAPWLFIEEANGDVTYVINQDAGRIELDLPCLEELVEKMRGYVELRRAS